MSEIMINNHYLVGFCVYRNVSYNIYIALEVPELLVYQIPRGLDTHFILPSKMFLCFRNLSSIQNHHVLGNRIQRDTPYHPFCHLNSGIFRNFYYIQPSYPSIISLPLNKYLNYKLPAS